MNTRRQVHLDCAKTRPARKNVWLSALSTGLFSAYGVLSPPLIPTGALPPPRYPLVNHGWKVEGDQGSTPGLLGPAPGQRPSWVLGAGRGRPSRCEDPGVSPRKILENSDAKSCILVTTCREISCFLKTTAKKSGDQYIVDSGQSPPVSTVVAPCL